MITARPSYGDCGGALVQAQQAGKMEAAGDTAWLKEQIAAQRARNKVLRDA
jgi:hypothetical protein